MTINKKQTSLGIASLASKTLKNDNSSKTAKILAASALAQTSSSKQTGPETEYLAGKVLSSVKYSDDTKTLAASVLSQSNKAR